MIEKARYDLHLDTPATGRLHAADVVILEDRGHVSQVGFRYTAEYLEHAAAFAIDPVQLPLRAGEFTLECRGGLPAFLDDYLPDAWGRKVLAYFALKQTGQPINANSAIACLRTLRRSRIGALELTEQQQPPEYSLGLPWDRLSDVERVATAIDDTPFEQLPPDIADLIYLANEGSGAGGARPKALVQHKGAAYLAKFNRRSGDPFNVARVERACLELARLAGLNVYGGQVVQSVGGREVLLLDRFDVEGPRRRHLITVNGLLKDNFQRDNIGVFRYDDIHELLQRHSVDYGADAEQLLRAMLFNAAINNTDDHERNFSLINDGTGYALSPAYDMVPSLATGEYHCAGFQYSPYPPKPGNAAALGKVFGLPKTAVSRIAEEVVDAIKQWEAVVEKCGVDEETASNIQKVIKI